MTAQPPDPDPDTTPGLELGGGVRPGDTPPESGATSGVSHREPEVSKSAPVIHLVLIAVFVLAVVGILIALIFTIW